MDVDEGFEAGGDGGFEDCGLGEEGLGLYLVKRLMRTASSSWLARSWVAIMFFRVLIRVASSESEQAGSSSPVHFVIAEAGTGGSWVIQY